MFQQSASLSLTFMMKRPTLPSLYTKVPKAKRNFFISTNAPHHREKGPIVLHFTPNHVSVGSETYILVVCHEKDVLPIDKEEINA
jgi:hypothetical protein